MRAVMAAAACAAVVLARPARADDGGDGNDDPIGYAEESTGRPTGVKCPDARPCVIDKDGAVFVTAKSWKVYYRLDHDDLDSPLMTGTADPEVVRQRIDRAVRAILALHAAKQAVVDCGAAGAVPQLIGSATGEAVVNVPRVKKTAAPAPLSLADADAAWLKARETIEDLGGSASSDPLTTLFSGLDTTAMTADTFKRPHLRWQRATLDHRVCKGDDCTDDEVIEASVLVVYSPESNHVYLLDRSVRLPTTQYNREASIRAFADQDVLFATLRALAIKSIVVDRGSLCAVPRVAGKNGWFALK
jgi:hypothetical protein